MRFNRDCINYKEQEGPPIVHHGPGGVRSEPAGKCGVGLFGFEGCPRECPHYEAHAATS